ncbi:MAG: ABC transporter ATP-binding protein [Abditibacteriaceae bacterium]
MPVLKANQLTKTYGKGEAAFTALNAIDLEIAKGQSVAILGKSGSGKSTLMHLLALLDSPTSGSVFVDGVDASKLSSGKLDKLRNQSFGFVFQQFFLNANQPVLENVILPLKIAGVSAAQRKERAMKVLAAVELDDKANSKANDLSGGQKQRLVIARALINEPQIIFADEPTGNLDSATGILIQDLLLRLNSERGITLVMVTHDWDLAAKCERFIEIKDGSIIKDDKR